MRLPVYRYLRGYVIDQGFSTRLDTALINEVVYRIPFEHLEPGPVGDYLEVFDFDPASACWYEPVDLAAEEISSQSGLAPSEGNPQFHQQFVYTVAMKTIRPWGAKTRSGEIGARSGGGSVGVSRLLEVAFACVSPLRRRLPAARVDRSPRPR
jgi:hypothetical protein